MGCCIPTSEAQKQKATNCFSDSKDEANIDNCDFLKRLTHALKYYQSLDVSDVNKFVEFTNMYGKVLNDYIHCIHTHGNDLENIHNQLINDKNFGECRLDKCLLFKRHFDRDRRRNKHGTGEKETSNPKVIYYSELFDNIHHHLFHLYQTGMRTKKSDLKQNSNDVYDNEEKDEYECIDNEFENRRKIIENKRNKFGLKVNRFND
eukprot:383614_1